MCCIRGSIVKSPCGVFLSKYLLTTLHLYKCVCTYDPDPKDQSLPYLSKPLNPNTKPKV